MQCTGGHPADGTGRSALSVLHEIKTAKREGLIKTYKMLKWENRLKSNSEPGQDKAKINVFLSR